MSFSINWFFLKKPSKYHFINIIIVILLTYKQKEYPVTFPKVRKQVNWSQGKCSREFWSTNSACGLNSSDSLKSNQGICDTGFACFDLKFWGQYLERRKKLQGNEHLGTMLYRHMLGNSSLWIWIQIHQLALSSLLSIFKTLSLGIIGFFTPETLNQG